MNRYASDPTIADAAALIRLASENPPGNEAAPAEYVAERLRRLGADVTLQQVAPGRLNAVGVFSFGPGPRLLFNSHLDVVPAQDPIQLQPELRDGRLIGRGACDAKGAVAAMLAACARLVGSDRPGAGTLIVAAVADEEVSGLGSRYLVQEGGVRADAAVVGEPTGNRVNLGCRGAYRARVRFFGRAVHSSDPDRGANAVYHAARFVLAVADWQRELARRPIPPAAAATVIAGGSKVNIIPDHCEVQVDRRLAPGETVADGERELGDLLEQLRRDDPELRWEVEPIGTPKAGVRIEEGHPLARLALAVTGQERGEFFRGGTDAPYLAEAGIPAIILGPGSLDQAHTADEWVGVADLHAAAGLYERIARGFLGGD